MKKLNVLGLLLLVTTMVISCSDKPKRLTDEQIVEVLEGKQISSVGFSSSGDLEYDYPKRMSVEYVENGVCYQQELDADTGLGEPIEKGPLNEKLYYTIGMNDLFSFDMDSVFQNAVNFIKKESEDSFEYFAIANVSITARLNWKKEKKIYRRITLQATKKGEDSEYKFSHRKVTTVRNFYEFKFEILDNSEVKFEE